MKQLAIKLTNISKKYELFGKKYSITDFFAYRTKKRLFYALKNINLTIYKGEKVGIVGTNGAGKTTLLNIISGITTPSTGSRIIDGNVVSLIELEAGFHPELTGIENIYLNGLIMGMKKSLIKKRIKDIIGFADIGSFINQPMYLYSSGMKLRLAFSVAIHADFDILILDENLSVGDKDFQVKSLNIIKELFKAGKTIIIATHYLDFMVKTCDRVIWIEEGIINSDGQVKKIINRYMKER